MKYGRPKGRRRIAVIASGALLVVVALAVGGCCHMPKWCCKQPGYTITIVKEGGNCVIRPDDTTGLYIHPGATVTFANTTKKKATVTATFGAYVEGHIFTVGKHDAVTRTVSDLPEGTTEFTINNTVHCGGTDNGGPRMVVTDPPGSND